MQSLHRCIGPRHVTTYPLRPSVRYVGFTDVQPHTAPPSTHKPISNLFTVHLAISLLRVRDHPEERAKLPALRLAKEGQRVMQHPLAATQATLFIHAQ
jgi:hypothetical protein